MFQFMVHKFCWAVFLAVFTTSMISAAESSPVPIRFKASIGGFTGTSYFVELRDGTLTCTESRKGIAKTVASTPTPTQWREFRKILDDIKVWEWRAKYPNDKGVFDGTQWSLDIAYADRAVKATGDNNYPDATDTRIPEPTETFNRYLEAIKKLTGGKTFR